MNINDFPEPVRLQGCVRVQTRRRTNMKNRLRAWLGIRLISDTEIDQTAIMVIRGVNDDDEWEDLSFPERMAQLLVDRVEARALNGDIPESSGKLMSGLVPVVVSLADDDASIELVDENVAGELVRQITLRLLEREVQP